MTVWQAIQTGVLKSFTVQGRASRPEFWWFWGFHFCLPAGLILLLPMTVFHTDPISAESVAVLGIVLYILTTPGAFCAAIRRRHDTGQTGQLAAILYGSVIATILLGALWLYQNETIRVIPIDMKTDLEENPEQILFLGPMYFFIWLLDQLFLFLILMTVTILVGLPISAACFILLAGLAKPSDPQTNRFGPPVTRSTT